MTARNNRQKNHRESVLDESATGGFGRVPPHHIEAEMAFLGSLLLGDPDAFSAVQDSIRSEDFYRENHGKIYAAMLATLARSEPVDLVTLKDELVRRGELDSVGGLVYLMQLGELEFTTANLPHYAKIVRGKSVSRQLIHAANAIARDAYEDADDVDAQVEGAEERVRSCASRQPSETVAHARDLTTASLPAIETRYQSGGGLAGISWGFSGLDYITGGMLPGDLIIVAARPSVGKSAWAGSLALKLAKRGEPVGIISAEMSKEALQERFVAHESQVNLRHIRNGKLTDDEWDRIGYAHSLLFDMPYAIDDASYITADQLRGKARNLKSVLGGLSLIVVDYLQYLSGHRDRNYPNRNEEVTDISRSLKALAREMRVPVVALCQLSRAVERREDKRPNLADLRDSGAIEQDADLVAFLYRDAYYQKKDVSASREDQSRPGEYPGTYPGTAAIAGPVPAEETEFIIGKQRNGETGFVRLGARLAYSRFDDWADEEMGPF